jgi:hypothetical protein
MAGRACGDGLMNQLVWRLRTNPTTTAVARRLWTVKPIAEWRLEVMVFVGLIGNEST